MFAKIKVWLTPARRSAIYKVAVAVFGVLVVAGVVTPEMIEQYKTAIVSLSGILAILTNLLAASHIDYTK